jgi:hypothetical protein
MTASDPADRTELTDDRLDSLLRSADDELLHHIQAAVDPAITLTAVMNIGTAGAEQARPDEPAHADQAAVLIMQRDVLIQISRTLARALDHARALDRAVDDALGLTDARDPGSFLRLNSTRAGVLALVLDRDRVRFRHLVRDLDRALELDRALANDLDFDRVLDRASDLDHDLASALNLGRDLTPDLGRALARADALALARNLARTLASDFTSALTRTCELAEREITASGADLSLLAIDDVEMVAGVVWDEETTWPPGIADHVRAASQEIRPGVYRVGGGSERDPAEYARH